MTDFDSQDVRRLAFDAAGLWGAVPATFEHVGDSANHVYSFKASDSKYFLRLTPGRERTRELVEAELDFVNYLHSRAAKVCPPVPSVNRRLVETKQGGGETFFACVFEDAAGERVEFGPDEVNPKHFRLCGRTLGRIHTLSKEFAPAASRRRFRWDEDDLLVNAGRYLPREETAAWAEYRRLTERLRARPKDRDTFGLVHGDFGPTNYRRRDGGLVVFDFDDCCYHWFAYDLAVIVYPHGWREEARALVGSLLEGYAEESDGTIPSEADLVEFCGHRQLLMFIYRAKLWGFSNLSPEQQSWFSKKRENIARGYVLHP